MAGYFPPHPRAPGLQEVVGLAVGWVGWKAQAARPTRRARRWQRSFTMAARDPLGVSTCTRNQTSPHNSPFPPSLLPSVPTSRAVEERSPTRKSSPQSRMIRGGKLATLASVNRHLCRAPPKEPRWRSRLPRGGPQCLPRSGVENRSRLGRKRARNPYLATARKVALSPLHYSSTQNRACHLDPALTYRASNQRVLTGRSRAVADHRVRGLLSRGCVRALALTVTQNMG